MNQKVYDYAIIGAGAAGLQLVIAMLADPWFKDKEILILDKDGKTDDDHTWCFWEQGTGQWDRLITRQWSQGVFETARKKIDFGLEPYSYKMLRSIDFYDDARTQIESANNVQWFKERVMDVKIGDTKTIETTESKYLALQIFDSRIDIEAIKNKESYLQLTQHFMGWEIETEEAMFDQDRFVMMDYRIKYGDSTSFTYVLPLSPKKALIEFTFFNKDLVTKKDYEELLVKYISEILKIKKYSIVKVEQGEIPMSNIPFHAASRKGIDKIGTAGSWVKPSSGYAFKNIEGYTQKLIANLKSGKAPSQGLLSAKFRFYDSLFLDVLSQDNSLGEHVFEDMYTKNSIQNIFKFLDEETTLMEELRIISSIRARPFLRALRRYLFKF